MGVSVTLADISNAQQITSAATALNSNADIIETAFTDVLSTSATTIPNSMNTNLDMNNNQMLNLPAPATLNSPARLVDVTGTPSLSVPPVGTSGATVPLLNANNTWSGIQTYSVAPVISTITNTGTLTLPTSTDTIVGRATTDTLTNKTLTAPTIATITNSGTLTLPSGADTLVGRASTDTLTNKTLTSPTITGTGSLTAASLTLSANASITGTLAAGATTITGNEAISGLLNTGGFARSSSTQTYTSNVALADIPGMTVTLGASSNYLVEFYLFMPTTTYANLAVALSGSCTATTLVGFALGYTGTTLSATGEITALNSGLTILANTGTQAIAHVMFRGFINTGTGGTLTVQAAQESSSANSAIVSANSYMKVFQVT